MIRDLTPEVLELSALATLLSPADTRYARERGVDEFSFAVDKHVLAWNYLVERSTVTEVVTRADVELICGLVLPEGLTDRDGLVEALVQLSLHRRATTLAVAHLEPAGKDPTTLGREALTNLVGDLSALTAATKGTHVGYYLRDARKRFEEVEARAHKVAEGGMVGWRTGLDTFDAVGDGWQKGDLVAVIGALNVGKSFFILWSAAQAWYYDNAKVLFISPESTQFDVYARLTAVQGHLDGRSLSNRAIRRGSIDLVEFEEYTADLEQKARDGHEEFIVVDSASTDGFSVVDIVSLARQHRPDILVIDGFHLISGAGETWESIKASADAIKTAAQALDMSVIAGSQAKRSAVMAPGDAPELGDAAYGMGLAEAANRVISLAQRPKNKMHRTFKIIKNRDDAVPRDSFYINFDVDTGNIQQVDKSEGKDGLIDGWEDFGRE